MNVEPMRAEAQRRRARVRYNALMKILRRAHMYVGLALAPPVLLYGVTAFLFNHPDWFSDRSVRLITPRDAAGTRLGSFPAPETLAARLVASFNQNAGAPVRLSPAQPPVYSRDLALTARTPGAEQVVFLELEGRWGTVRSAPSPPAVSTPPWADVPVHLDPVPAHAARDAVAAIMTRWGTRPEVVKVRTPPELIFGVEGDGETWRVAYNLEPEALNVRPWKPDLSTRRFLNGMHLACRYPSQVGIRWFWALLVDAMALAMVFWGVSGLLMWWQMKLLRHPGSLVLLAALVGSILLATGMHGVLGR